MSFTALNLSAEDAALDAEEHTRELQIEQAFKIFQQALKHQKDGEFTLADLQFKELFKIQVVIDDARSIITPTVRTLRYLAHRNRGLLHFEELRSKIDSLDLSRALDCLLNCIDDLITCLEYTDGDTTVVTLLLGIFKLMKNDRLSRFVVEYELTKEENKDSIVHVRNRHKSKDHLLFEQEEKKILVNICMVQPSSVDPNLPALKGQDLTFLKPVIDFISTREEIFLEAQRKKVRIPNPTWKSLASELNNLLPRSKIKHNKAKDLYLLLENPIISVSFEYGELVGTKSTKLTQVTEASSNEDCAFTYPRNADEHGAIETPECVVNGEEGIEVKRKDVTDPGNVELKANLNTRTTEDIIETENVNSHSGEAMAIDTNEDFEKKRRASGDIPQRSSKRVRQLNDTDSGHESNTIGDQSFIENFNLYLEKLGVKFEFDMQSLTAPQEKSSYLHLGDFFTALQNWNNKLTETLFQDSADSDSSEIALTELFNSSTFTGSLISDETLVELDDSSVTDFIQKHQGLHYTYVRTSFLQALLTQDEDTCPITDFVFEKDLFNSLENLVLISEEAIFSDFTSSSFQNYGISVFEVLLNSWISLKQRSKARGLSIKQQSDIAHQIELLHPVVLRWKLYLHDQDLTELKLYYRFHWCSLLYLQHMKGLPIDQIKDEFNNFYIKFSNESVAITVLNPNYEFIPSLNSATIKGQSDKLNVITSFERSLNSAESEDTINLLESLLLSTTSSDLSEEQQSMIRFINESSIALKLKLWKILLRYYSRESKLGSYGEAFKLVLPLLFEQLTSEVYSSQSEPQRYQILVTTIAYFGDYVSGFAQLLQDHEWDSSVFDRELLQRTLIFFSALYPYCLFEGSFKIHKRDGSKAISKIRDIVIDTFTVIFSLFLHDTSVRDQLELFNVIHAEVGNMSFCDASNGRLLRSGQDVLKAADTTLFEAELLQHLNCRFHIFITSETFIPFDHHTSKSEFNRESALEFSDYILDSILKKKNIIFQSSLKPELKNALETLQRAFGEPDLEHSPYQRNDNLLHLFLETNLDLLVFRDALTGTLTQQFRKSIRPEQHVFDKGVYYLEGLINLNVYRTRRKVAQARGSDLDYIIKMLKYDLVTGSNRLETWLLLGEAYSFMTEDELTWTADKLNSLDKKMGTANIQRRSILCYLMAVSVMANSGTDADETLKSTLFSSLSREVYHSLFTPMQSLCFLTASERKVLTDGNVVGVSAVITSSKRSSVLKIIERTLLVAISADKSDWQNYLLLSKVRHKLKYPARKVINTVAKSCALNNTQIESLYLLCSLLYKYVKDRYYESNKAIKSLRQIPLFDEIIVSTKEDPDFDSLLVECLRKLVSIDKRKWHHRPRYRIAKIHYDKGDYQAAYDEIESIVALKATNKSLISIWKPELEPAGKHFAYTSEYIDFFLDVAEKLFELQNLVLFTKKLRRFGASMIDLPKHWDKAISKVCQLVKEVVGAEPGYTDLEVPRLNFTEFMQKSDTLIKIYKSEEVQSDEIPLFVLLLEIYELRKMNNGFGSTSLIDDTFNCVYLKFYLKLESEGKLALTEPSVEAENTTKSTPVKSKVARRDILAVAANLSKVLESKLKNERITDDKGFEITTELREAHLKRSDTDATNLLREYNREIMLTPKPRTPIAETPDAKSETPTTIVLKADYEVQSKLQSLTNDAMDEQKADAPGLQS